MLGWVGVVRATEFEKFWLQQRKGSLESGIVSALLASESLARCKAAAAAQRLQSQQPSRACLAELLS